jgi:CheY-like chemotaxis protein
VDLVILDLLMEGMDGFEVASAFKARASTASVPILVLTAKDLTLEERRRLLDKVNSLVQKGTASPAALVTAIRDLLARHPRRG